MRFSMKVHACLRLCIRSKVADKSQNAVFRFASSMDSLEPKPMVKAGIEALGNTLPHAPPPYRCVVTVDA